MSNDPNAKKAPSDDPLVIASVTFRQVTTIGGYGNDSWSLETASRTQLHLRVRCEETPKGLVFHYANGAVYQRITVPWGNIADITEVPRSALKDTTRQFLETAGRR